MTRPLRFAWPLTAIVSLGLFLVSLFYQRPAMVWPLNIYDEGIIVYGSVRVMEGQLPYRDFWTQYSPAQLYILAGLFKVLGKQIMIERWWDVLIRAALMLGMGALAARLSDRLVSRASGFFVWLMGLLWVTYYGFFGYPIFQGLLFSLLSLGALTQAFVVSADGATPSARRWYLLSGLLLGIATLFRHDMAVYVGAAQTIVIFGQTLTQSSVGVPQRLRTGAINWLILAGGATVLVLPVFLFLIAQMPLYTLLDQLFIFPLTIFPKVRDLPYPDLKGRLEELPFYAPFLIYALAAFIAIAQLRRGQSQDKALAWGTLAVVLFGLFGWNQARVRSDTIHTVQFFLPSVVLLPVLYRAGSRRVNLLGYLCAAIAIVLAVAFSINPIAQYLETRKLPNNPDVQRSLKLTLPIAQGAVMSTEQLFAVQTIQGLTQPGEPVYVGLSNHSRVFANDVMFYFVMDRPSPTRYHELHPGLVNTVAVQQEMIADLERQHVRYLVLTNMFEGAREPNDTAIDSKVTLLDDYIKAHYQQAHILGSYRILKLKSKN